MEKVKIRHYFDSRSFKRPYAETIPEKLIKLSDVSSRHMTRINIHGWIKYSFVCFKNIKPYWRENKLPQIIHVGSCNLHFVHGALNLVLRCQTRSCIKVLKAMLQFFTILQPGEVFTLKNLYHKFFNCNFDKQDGLKMLKLYHGPWWFGDLLLKLLSILFL